MVFIVVGGALKYCGGWRIEVRGGEEDIRLDSGSKFLVSTRGTSAWGGRCSNGRLFVLHFVVRLKNSDTAMTKNSANQNLTF